VGEASIARASGAVQSASVDIVIPVYNEEATLRSSITALAEHLTQHFPYPWRIVVANNASTDRTADIGAELAHERPGLVELIDLDQKGRGRALKAAWLASEADVMCYMDVDLSTNLAHLVPLIAPLVEGKYHIATGSRLMHSARVTRQWKREIISRAYNIIVRVMFPRRRFVDAQCGFKAISRDAARRLLPGIVDTGWFFDTELLLRAEQSGLHVWEVPVEWIEDLDTRVKIVSTAMGDLQGLWRVRRTPFAAAYPALSR
jgi:glycosyltransferase involved in cell wall biosynthesis